MGMYRRRTTMIVTGLVTALALALPGTAASVAAEGGTVNIADTDATPETTSLFSYLRDLQGQGVVFGHQHDTDNGLTFDQANGVNSDVFAGTGDYPGMFGWDTLILEGREAPGTGTLAANGTQNAQALADGMKNADRLGGINTLSAHMNNFATGGDFTTTTGRPVSQILPGAPKNAEFNAYLDLIALTASLAVDENGTRIPIIFRPFHENTGSWFWWGAAHATAGEYKEIFRYTVEYLRAAGVTNFLYAYSPNGSFGGDPTRYLATYPGDQWVDVMGYDFYENSNASDNSDAWIAQMIPDLGMVTDLAAERGKIPALTEFGRNGDRTIKPTGNKSLTFYTDILNAIKSDPKAQRIAYMETWSNWGPEEFYVPYPAFGTTPEHEMYQDFLAFYNDDFSLFARDTAADKYDRVETAASPAASLRVVSPADGVRITNPETIVRVKATTDEPTSVVYQVDGDATQYPLTLADGYYTGTWSIGSENLINGPAGITVTARYADGSSREATSQVILGGTPEFPVGVIDDFEGYGADASLRAAYGFNNDTSDLISLADDVVGAGSHAVAMSYDFGPREYAGWGKAFPTAQDWRGFTQLDGFLAPDGSNQKLVLQFDAGGATFEAYPSLAGTTAGDFAISFSDFRDKANPALSPTSAQLASVTQFYVYMNQVGAPSSGRIVLDELRAVSGSATPTLPVDEPTVPAGTEIVDDFEGYADDAALQSAWTRAGAATLSLSTDVVGSGAAAGVFPYLDGFTEFQRAIGKNWSSFTQLKMWVQADSDRKIVLQFVAGGNFYDAAVEVTAGAGREIAIPFADFIPSPFQGRDTALRLTPGELGSAQSLAVFIEPTATSGGRTGSVVLDDIRAGVLLEEPPTTPVDNPVPPVQQPAPVVGAGVGVGSGGGAGSGLAATGANDQVLVGLTVTGVLMLMLGAVLLRLRRLRAAQARRSV